MFITFEGIEKSGKSTQAKLLYNYLKNKNYPVVLTKEPGGTKLGIKLKKIILAEDLNLAPWSELFLFLADRAEHVEKVIIPALKAGKIVISDRFLDSSVVYQGWARNITAIKVKLIHKLFLGDIKPDISFFFVGNFKKRDKKDRIEKEDDTFFEIVKEGYLQEAKSNPGRIKIIKVDFKDKESIKGEIISYIAPLLKEWEEKNLKNM